MYYETECSNSECEHYFEDTIGKGLCKRRWICTTHGFIIKDVEDSPSIRDSRYKGPDDLSWPRKGEKE